MGILAIVVLLCIFFIIYNIIKKTNQPKIDTVEVTQISSEKSIEEKVSETFLGFNGIFTDIIVNDSSNKEFLKKELEDARSFIDFEALAEDKFVKLVSDKIDEYNYDIHFESDKDKIKLIRAFVRSIMLEHQNLYYNIFADKVQANIENGDKIEQEEIEKNKKYGKEPEGDPVLHKNENPVLESTESYDNSYAADGDYDTESEDGMDRLVSMNVAEIFVSDNV